MINLGEVKQIINRLALEKTMEQNGDLSNEVSYIMYRTDIFECGDDKIISGHLRKNRTR